METEIELKFFVSPDYSDTLLAEIAEFKVLQHGRRQLGNTYFDTSDNWLRQHDIGLRIRRFDDVYIQTVKTAGRVVAGLHQRPEYNAEHNCNTPNLSLHPSDIWPEGKSIEQLDVEIMPIFATNFVREQWLVATPDGSQIEIAFDQGDVVSGEKQQPICEVELELKSGQTDALFSLARMISKRGGVRLGNLSKAARGYRLANGIDTDAIKPLALVETLASDSVESCFIKSLEHGLSHWFYHEQIFFESGSFKALDEVRHAVCFIRQVLSVYREVIPRKASALLRQELKWFERELDWLKEYEYLDGLLKEKGYILRKLDARKFLVGELKKYKKSLPAIEECEKLLQSARYVALILDLSRWLLVQGWQPFVNNKSREALAKPIREFSETQLDHSWDELLIAFPVGQTLSSAEYIDQQYNLTRNLYTGIGFANLYDEERRNAFRHPWADLLHGIDSLLALKPLQGLVESLKGEEKEQLVRWLIRQETSILHAMEQTRAIGVSASPYWKVM